eukprot:3372092-Amphidinium_carterae.1
MWNSTPRHVPTCDEVGVDCAHFKSGYVYGTGDTAAYSGKERRCHCPSQRSTGGQMQTNLMWMCD